MGARNMWKMLHLLNNTARQGLTTGELDRAGVHCEPDTRQILEALGAVQRSVRGGSEFWTLAPGARGVLNMCTVAMRLGDAAEVQVDRNSVFCVMPFSAPWSNAVWESCIQVGMKDTDLKPERGDTTLRTGNLVQNVWNAILRCGCVVADLSAPNPNVYYELGLAHALGREAFVMVQKRTEFPADLKGTHYLEYDLGNLAKAARDLRAQLVAWRDREDVQVAGVEALFT